MKKCCHTSRIAVIIGTLDSQNRRVKLIADFDGNSAKFAQKYDQSAGKHNLIADFDGNSAKFAQKYDQSAGKHTYLPAPD